MFSKKATKIDEIFTVHLTLCSKHQIDGEGLVIFVAFLENTNFTYYITNKHIAIVLEAIHFQNTQKYNSS